MNLQFTCVFSPQKCGFMSISQQETSDKRKMNRMIPRNTCSILYFLPVFLIPLVFSCVQNSKVIIQEETVRREDSIPILTSAPETPGSVESSKETLLEAGGIAESTESPAETSDQDMKLIIEEPVFLEPPVRRNRNISGDISGEALAMVYPQGLERTAFPSVPDRKLIPPIPEYIQGQGLIVESSLSDFLKYNNPKVVDFSKELAKLYVEEAVIEGINHDIAFAQMCLETGFLNFGGLVTAEMNNFCGLGATGSGQQGEWFPDPRTGVRAHIQHLKAYSTVEKPKQELVDPRYFYVRYGSAPKISGLSGTWAEDIYYGEKINNILKRLYEFTFFKETAAFE